MLRVEQQASGDDAPVVMLNLNRYTTTAGFPDGDEYRRYMARLEHSVGAGGGAVLWRSPVTDAVIGCDHDDYDEILAVWYPSHTAFLALPNAEGAELMFESRRECVANATILALPADRDPLRPT
jgi:hypothetical protein